MSEYRAGQTALLAAVEEVEPLVGAWRQRFDASAAAGVPAHVTVLVPFLDVDRVDSAVLDDLSTLIGGHRSFTVRFDRCQRFPDVLYLAPTPDQPFRALTEAIVARWPEAPPYGAQFSEITPHLTVAHGQAPSVLDTVEAALTARLPITADIHSVRLFVSHGNGWHHRAEFPLLG